MGDTTTVKVSKDTWRRLTARKEPSLSYDEIISDLLDEVESDGGESPDGAQATN